MSDQSPKRAGNPAWVKGTSGNPKGRPRTGLALAERIRERLDPDTILQLAERLADDETVSLKDRLMALLQLAQLGYTKPPTSTDVTITATSGSRRFDDLTPDQLRAEIAARRAQLGLASAPIIDAITVENSQTDG